MLERLDIGDGEDAEKVRRSFDNELGVSGWGTPGRPLDPEVEKDPDAPSWWTGEEDASQAFLASQGVIFTDG